jgi:serine protease Do
MAMFKKIIIGTLVLLPLLAGAPICVKHAQAVKSFPVPIAELKQVTEKWLDQVCHGVFDRELEMGIVQYTCKRDNRHVQVILKPRSALATDVTIRADNNDSNAIGFENKLAAFIDTYFNPTVVDGEQSGTNANIPATVFSRSDAVVCIQSEQDQSSIQFSGFIIDQAGTIICTTHDLRQFGKLTITDSKGRVFNGEVVKFDEKIDLALIHTTITPHAHVTLFNGKRTLQKGTPIYSIGCPVNQANTVTTGTVNDPPVRVDQLVYWQVNMQILPGSSGSPVFDDQGELVGMIKGRDRKDNAIGFLIPMDRMKRFIDEFQ